jgi:hypothetical protein
MRPDDPIATTPILVRIRHADLDEIGFTDALTHNLRRGRFLLLIVGAGIREGMEAIAEYLQPQAGLHFLHSALSRCRSLPWRTEPDW